MVAVLEVEKFLIQTVIYLGTLGDCFSNKFFQARFTDRQLHGGKKKNIYEKQVRAIVRDKGYK